MSSRRSARVRLRGKDVINPKMETGEIEVVAEQLLRSERCQACRRFLQPKMRSHNEEVRLKYRYLDLRRQEMQHNLKMRHDIALAIRQYLVEPGISGD